MLASSKVEPLRSALAACAVALGCAFLPTAAGATSVLFAGTDPQGGLLSGSADVATEGNAQPAQAFTARFSNLLQEGFMVDSVTFGLLDVRSVFWFTPGNPSGPGNATFTFDLNGSGPNQGDLSGSSCFYNCFNLRTSGEFSAAFTTTVTSYSDVTEMPEPATVALLGVSVIGVAGLRRRGNSNLAA